MPEENQIRFVKKPGPGACAAGISENLAAMLGNAQARFYNQETAVQASRAKISIGWLGLFKKMNRGK